MPFNGSGGFEPLPPPDFPAVSGEVIRSTEYNNVIEDLMAGLSNCLTRDGQAPMTQNLPMAGYKVTGAGLGTLATDYATVGQSLILRGALGTVDWNTITTSGVYDVTAGSTSGGSSNYPAVSVGTLLVENNGLGVVSQTVVSKLGSYTRAYASATWSAWSTSISPVASFAALATTEASLGEIVIVSGLGEFSVVSGAGSVIDDYQSTSASASVHFERINYHDSTIPQYYLPAPKPSKKKAIQDELQNAYEGLILGGGYYGAGVLASDWVYETALNNLGGTNGTFNVRARFGRTIDAGIKAGGNIVFNVQMGSNVAGVSCVAYSFASADLPSTGRAARGTLVNGGGGLFSVTVAASGAWSDWLGIEVNMVPVNTANNATLHQETWVVKRVWMTQAGPAILDTNTARISDGVNLAQLAVKVANTTFWPEQITYDSFTYLLNHSRYMTGAQVAACWIAASGGVSTGYGLISAPVTLARAAAICLLGAAQRFILKDAEVD